jgi:zinc transport system substrate-binding protein
MQRLLLILASLLLWTNLAMAKPLVVASINPLGLIAREIAGSQAEVQILIPVTASHHDHPLKVSDHNLLRSADLVVWVGPELESFLQKPLANLPREKVLSVYQLSGLFWPAEDLHAGEHHHERDPHLWLDPRNAVLMAKVLSEKLVHLDPTNAIVYRSNLQAFALRMMQLDVKLEQVLKPVSRRGFAVYHEGYSHFVGHYGLRQLNYVTFTPEQKPGARHMTELRQQLAKDGKCLFLEPYNDMTSARELARELNLKIGSLDPLGGQNTTSYTQLMEQLAAAFVACLGDGT